MTDYRYVQLLRHLFGDVLAASHAAEHLLEMKRCFGCLYGNWHKRRQTCPIWEIMENKKEEAEVAYKHITAEVAKEIMDSEKNIVILDVRTQEEYSLGHIRGAVCLPNEEIMEEPKELADKSQKILVYCRSGIRSVQAAQKLANMGYENVLEFGGILEWPYREMVE